MKKNINIFEINLRVAVKRFQKGNDLIKTEDIPDEYWLSIKDKGLNAIWLMGIWEPTPQSIEKHCFSSYLVQSYVRALKNWRREDVIGSPYSINAYRLNKNLFHEENLFYLKKKLNKLGLKLLVDFVPNHFSSDSEYLITKPELFINVNEDVYNSDPHTFFKHTNNKFFAHGRDPFFPAWTDTAQLNYFNIETREFMIEELKKISEMSDGVRCDMAMLVLNNTFNNTWGGIASKSYEEIVKEDFWFNAIKRVKKINNDFIFIAEVYWDLEYALQQQGFDFTYDKRLYDRLLNAPVASIRDHLTADKDFQFKSIRFIENHDEERAAHAFGNERSAAAAVVISTIQGAKLFHDGQFEGKKIKLPVQLGREEKENVNQFLICFYEKIFKLLKLDVINEGEWELLPPQSSWSNNNSYQNFLIWIWRYKNENLLVAVNYSNQTSQCRVKFNIECNADEVILNDLIGEEEYKRSVKEIKEEGLYIELSAWASHAFFFNNN